MSIVISSERNSGDSNQRHPWFAIFILLQNECFRGYTGISLSVCPPVCLCVSVSVCVKNICFCQSTGGGIKSLSYFLFIYLSLLQNNPRCKQPLERAPLERFLYFILLFIYLFIYFNLFFIIYLFIY